MEAKAKAKEKITIASKCTLVGQDAILSHKPEAYLW